MSHFEYFGLLASIYIAPTLPRGGQLTIAAVWLALQCAEYLKGAA